MNKKFYETPKMEDWEMEIETVLQDQSNGSPEFGGEGSEDDF